MKNNQTISNVAACVLALAVEKAGRTPRRWKSRRLPASTPLTHLPRFGTWRMKAKAKARGYRQPWRYWIAGTGAHGSR